MGISGLLPKLKSIETPIHLKELTGLRVGIDAYVWLHKGAYACSSELCMGIATDKYIAYCMKWVEFLKSYNIIPVLVFDGGRLPTKGGKENERHDRRQAYKKQAVEQLSMGNSSAANEHFQKAVDVTPTMAFNLIKILRQEGVEFIVAPYEADAQLAFLSISNYVDAIITEDSDLIPYGASRIIFKLDKLGNGIEIRTENLANTKEFDFKNFTRDNFRHMCILSGCDYLPSLPGFGLKTAYQFISKYKDINKVLNAIATTKNIVIPPSYEEDFKKADLTFLHQRVWDPEAKKLVTLTPFPLDIVDDLEFIGPAMDNEFCRHIAEGMQVGNIDPSSGKFFEDSEATIRDAKIYLQKRQKYTPPSKNPPQQKNHIMSYFCTSQAYTSKPLELIDFLLNYPTSHPVASSPTPSHQRNPPSTKPNQNCNGPFTVKMAKTPQSVLTKPIPKPIPKPTPKQTPKTIPKPIYEQKQTHSSPVIAPNTPEKDIVLKSRFFTSSTLFDPPKVIEISPDSSPVTPRASQSRLSDLKTKKTPSTPLSFPKSSDDDSSDHSFEIEVIERPQLKRVDSDLEVLEKRPFPFTPRYSGLKRKRSNSDVPQTKPKPQLHSLQPNKLSVPSFYSPLLRQSRLTFQPLHLRGERSPSPSSDIEYDFVSEPKRPYKQKKTATMTVVPESPPTEEENRSPQYTRVVMDSPVPDDFVPDTPPTQPVQILESDDEETIEWRNDRSGSLLYHQLEENTTRNDSGELFFSDFDSQSLETFPTNHCSLNKVCSS